MKPRCIITSHINPHLSGVAKFNHILGGFLKTPCIGMVEALKLECGPVLFSVKLNDNSPEELAQVRITVKAIKEKRIVFDVFFHTFSGNELEYSLVEYSRRIFCANAEIRHMLEGINKPLLLGWCPGLLNDNVILHESKLNLFSFGMAHKLKVGYYKRLYKLLNKRNIEYTLWISTAFHEKANLGDFDLISNELGDIFGDHICFLGFLSDEAVNFFLDRTHLFVAFFEKGVRSNNTSVLGAMKRGCSVLTNCDEYSPLWMKHRGNFLDISRCSAEDFTPDVLKKVSLEAKADVVKYSGWEALAQLITSKERINE